MYAIRSYYGRQGMALRYVIIDDTAFVFDSGTVKLFRMDGEERVEIVDLV